MELPVLQLKLRHQLKGSTTRHEYCNTSIVNLHCTSAQTLYDTCNPTSCVLNYLHQLNLFSFDKTPFVLFCFDWQVTTILAQKEFFFTG